MYHKLLKKARDNARESYDPAREVKLQRSKRQARDAEDDVSLLSGKGMSEVRKALVPQRSPKEMLDIEDPITSIFNKVYASNQSIKEQVKGMFHEDTGVFEPIDTRSVDTSESDEYSMDSFIKKLLGKESSGRFNITTVSDEETGEKVFGGFQFSEGRLADYKRATKEKFTTKQFLDDPKLQMRVAEWHIADLDELIDTLDRSQFTSRDGLRAVGHLGGRTGLKNFVKSGGKDNAQDRFGTSLMKYYNDFK